MADKFADEIIDITTQLLNSIAAGDWKAYSTLCDPDITAFEPEARGQLVAGLDFHKFYFNLERSKSPRNITLCSPKVWQLGASAAAGTSIGAAGSQGTAVSDLRSASV